MTWTDRGQRVIVLPLDPRITPFKAGPMISAFVHLVAFLAALLV
jgi:hypothetical protein